MNKPIVFFALFSLYLFTRFYNLLLLPVFNDEALYIRFAQIISSDFDSLFVPLAQPNEPLFMWINALIYNFFSDPLFSGRFISVLSGLGCMAGIYYVGKIFFSHRTGIASAIIYIVLPYPLIFDRMAHVDSLLNFFNIWFIGITYLILDERPPLGTKAALAGFLAGGALLTKSSALLFLVLPVLYLPFSGINYRKIRLLLLVYFIAFLLFLPVLFADQKPVLAGGDKVFHNISFLYSVKELIELPLQSWLQKFSEPSDYLLAYITLPIIFLAFYGLYLTISRNHYKGLVLLLWFLFPALVFSVVAKFSYSRWFLFSSPPLIIASGVAIAEIQGWFFNIVRWKKGILRHTLFSILMFLFFYPSLVFGYKLLVDPVHAPWVDSDKEQYIANEYSGYGIPELIRFFKTVGKKNPVTVFVTDNWGNPGDALFLYLEKENNIKIHTSWWWADKPIIPRGAGSVQVFNNNYQGGKGLYLKRSEIENNRGNTYFVCRSTAYSQRDFLTVNPDFKLIKKFMKPESNVGYFLYKWTGYYD